MHRIINGLSAGFLSSLMIVVALSFVDYASRNDYYGVAHWLE